ncbi:chloride channel protein [Desulfothermus okinawensis JCM 13304]
MENIISEISSLWKTIKDVYKGISSFRLIMLSVLVGILAGLAAALFFFGIEWTKFKLIHHLAGVSIPGPSGEEIFKGNPGEFRPWLIPVFTTLVGLITGVLVKKFIPYAQQDHITDGTDTITRAFHQNEGRIKPLVTFLKGLTAVFTIGSGGSAGREGPITLIGGGIGSYLASLLKLSPKERRILLLAGAGGGLGAIFRAPLGGAITGVEIIYKEDFESEALLPAIISSVIAYTVFTLIYGNHPIFEIPHFYFSPKELPFYLILALFCALCGFLYVKTFFFIKYSIFQEIKKRAGLVITCGLGGLVMGLMGMFMPYVLSGGYGYLELAILGKLSLLTMVTLMVAKTIATSVTIGSEMSGGMFAPTLFVGGMAGGIIGTYAHIHFPHFVQHPGAFVLVGMASFFAGAGSAPIGPFIIVCELTQDYGLLAPLMFCSAICIFFNRNISIYENQLDNKFQSPAHSGELFVDILSDHKVEELLDELDPVYVVPEEMKFSDFKRKIFINTTQYSFPVVDKNGKLTGIFSSSDFRHVLFNPEIENLVIIKDIAVSNVVVTYPDETLNIALDKLTNKNIDALPVLSDRDDGKILGLLRRKSIIGFYNKLVEGLKATKL